MRKQSALLRLLSDNRKSIPGLIYLTALMLLSGLFKSFAAKFLGLAIDAGVAARTGEIVRFSVYTLFMYGGDALRLMLFNIETARVIEKMFLGIKKQAFDAVAHCRLSAYDAGMNSGDMLARVTSDLPTLSKRIAEGFTWLISVFSRGLIALIFCLSVSWKLSAIYVVMLPILIYLMNKIGSPIQKLQREAAKNGGRAYGVMGEMMENNAVIKAFRAEKYMNVRFKRETEAQRSSLDGAAKKGSLMTLTAYLADVILMAVLFVFGGYLIAAKEITVGACIMFVTLSGSIREAFDLVDKGISTLRESEALAERLYEALDLPSEKRLEAPQPSVDSSAPVVVMRGVSFAYTPENDVLKGVNLLIPRGRHVGVIGASGCGKSTLAKLLCCLYPDYAGDFTLFGQSVRAADADELRRSIAVVSQEAYLFSGTVAQNVRYGCPDATDAQIENALRGARLWEDVQSLENGVDTPIGDNGSRLSGGQKQRLAIARALIRNAELIILDEVSSALDTVTERELQRTLDEAFRDKTLLVIAHRFASLSSVDYVYCMEDGAIVEDGEKDALLAKDSRLRAMAAAQGGAEGGDLHA